MRGREIGWGVFLAGLPFAHLLFRPKSGLLLQPTGLDFWHSHALWAHGWIILLTCAWISKGGLPIRSKALAACVGWVGLCWLWAWNMSVVKLKLYPLVLSLGLLHVVSLVLFYLSATAQWTRESLQHLLRWIAMTAWVVVAYCGLQAMNLDQFTANIDNHSGDLMVGTIGNPTHLAAHLAFLLPLVLLQQRLAWRLLACVMVVMIFMTKSVAGIGSAGIALVVWWWASHPKWAFGVVGLCFVGGVIVLLNRQFNTHGRLAAWAEFWEVFRHQPILGYGAGFVMEFSRTVKETSPIFKWRHVHNEFFQIAIEHGVIGLSLVGWFLWETLQQARRAMQAPEGRALAAVLAAFLVNALVHFTAHLWVLGAFGLVAVCGLRVLAKELSDGLPYNTQAVTR